MSTNRRSFLKLAAAGGALLSAAAHAAVPPVKPAAYKRIATEEAWGPVELFKAWRKVLDTKSADYVGLSALWANLDNMTRFTDRLSDLGEGRLNAMNTAGIDMQVLSLTAPGVQVLSPADGTAIASASNDILVDAIKAHPDRYAGLLAIAPQDPKNAAAEIARRMKQPGIKGIIVNSHTNGEYLSDKKYWGILEAAEANNAPIYIHPREPSPGMLKPFVEQDLQRGDLGFGVEVALHTQALINGGAFDRFPNLKLVIGHGGEGIPYQLYRLDKTWPVRRANLRSKEPPSYYMKKNIYITTSGVAWAPAVIFAQQVLGVDQVLYAMDYPYQYDVEEVHAMDALPISYDDKKKFFQTNAERVFNLTGRAS